MVRNRPAFAVDEEGKEFRCPCCLVLPTRKFRIEADKMGGCSRVQPPSRPKERSHGVSLLIR